MTVRSCNVLPGKGIRILTAWVLVAATLGLDTVNGYSTAPAFAETSSVLAQAIAAARTASHCGPLQYDAAAEHAAQTINNSTRVYLNHTADNIPIDDTHPTALAKDLGVGGAQVHSLKGAGPTDAEAIKGLLLQGYNVIPDCAYREYGVSMVYEESTGYSLATAVLVGP